MMGQMMICTPCMSNYYLCNFLEIIDNKKLEESDGTNIYIMHVKRYASRIYSGLVGYVAHDNVY
jgi:hypothetical protein